MSIAGTIVFPGGRTGLTAEFPPCRVLVTGGSGFLGAPLCRRLAAAGAEVHATSRSPRTGGGALRWWRVDLEDGAELGELCAEVRPDIVYHLAGVINGAPDPRLLLPTFKSLLVSTVNLLMLATEQRWRRLVLVGSLEEPVGDQIELGPTSPYGAAKFAATAYARMCHRVFGTPVVVARTFMTYGPGQPEWKVMPYTILELLAGRAPELSSGRRRLDWVYVDDVVDGLLRAGCTAGIDGLTVDLGSGVAVSLREIVERVTKLLGSPVRPKFGTKPDRPLDGEIKVADTEHTHSVLGWQPTTSLDEGLASAVRWYRGGGDTAAPAPAPEPQPNQTKPFSGRPSRK
jgi:nucleoside-diphosphate-sugar epimerase